MGGAKSRSTKAVPASTARSTCENSQRSRNVVQSGIEVSLSPAVFAEKKRALAGLSFSLARQSLFTG